MASPSFVSAVSAFAIGLCLWTKVGASARLTLGVVKAVALTVMASNLVLAYYVTVSRQLGLGYELFNDVSRLRAFSTSTSLAALAFACAVLDSGWARRMALAQILGLGVAALAAYSALDALFTELISPQALTQSPMTPRAALVVGILGLAVAAFQPIQTLGSVVFARTEAGTLIRRLLTISIVVPLAVGLVSLFGQHWKALDIGTNAALLTVSSAGFLIGFVLVSGFAHHRADEARHAAEEALAKTRERLHGILEYAGAAIVVKDLAGKYVVANRRFLETYRFEQEDVIGHSDHELFPENVADHFSRLDREAIEGGGPVESEVALTIRGEKRHFLTVKFPLFDEKGRAYGVGCIATDITDIKRAEAAAQAAREDAEKANKAKNEFLARMSHELRTPLNAVLGFAQILELQGATPSQKEAIDLISQAGKHLLSLIDEVLDLSKVEAGLLTADLRPASIDRVVEDALLLVQPAVVRSGARVEIVRQPIGKPCVLADEKRLRQILANLLSNALKYAGQEARITVTLSEEPAGTLRIHVADDGPGIPPEKRHLLFQPFERIGAGGEGTGLGLALSKGMAEAMHGRLYFDENHAPGAAFVVELPLCDTDATPSQGLPFEDVPSFDAATATKRVLYIEDNRANVELMKHILASRPKFELHAAGDGVRGIELASSGEYDLVLLDLNLPGISGEELLERLRKVPATKDLPVVVVTADATQQTREKCLALGATGFVLKPFDIAEVLTILDRILQSGR